MSVSRLPSADDPALVAVAGLQRLLNRLAQALADYTPPPVDPDRPRMDTFNLPRLDALPPSYEAMMAVVMRRKGSR